MENLVSYKPSAYYFRKALREATTADRARQIGMHLCTELETLKAWVREQGMIPPKWNLMNSEISEKNWGHLVEMQIEG